MKHISFKDLLFEWQIEVYYGISGEDFEAEMRSLYNINLNDEEQWDRNNEGYVVEHKGHKIIWTETEDLATLGHEANHVAFNAVSPVIDIDMNTYEIVCRYQEMIVRKVLEHEQN